MIQMTAIRQISSKTWRLVVLGLLLTTGACGDSDLATPEQQIRATIDAIVAAAEERSTSSVMEFVNDDYVDHEGYSKDDIRRIVQVHMLRNQNITIFTRIQSLEVNDGVATVELSAAMAARGVDLSQEQNRLRADTHHFSVVLSDPDQDQQWVVDSVSWRRGWD